MVTTAALGVVPVPLVPFRFPRRHPIKYESWGTQVTYEPRARAGGMRGEGL